MVKKATSGVLVMLLLFGLFSFCIGPSAKAQVATPSKAVITVSGVPSGTTGLAVEVTVDTSIVTLSSSATSSVSGALVVVGSMSEGVGIIGTSGNLPTSFTIDAPLTGVANGTSMLTVGMVLDMLGGTAITGASAAVDKSSVAVASSSSTSTTSSTSSTSSSGAGGMLSADSFTVTIDGAGVGQTSALNLTVAFTDSAVATLDTGVTFMGTGATQLLTDVNPTTGVLTAVWSGTITDNKAVITGMLKPGSKGGTTMIGISKVEASGGTDITSSVAVTVSPDSVTNSAAVAESDCGTFTLIGPDSATGPGKVAVAFSIEDGASGLSATLNGKNVDLISTTEGAPDLGIAIISLGTSDAALSLSAMCGGMSASADLGTLTVEAGSGKAPKVSSAFSNNTGSGTSLVIMGSGFDKDNTTVEIIPTDRSASKSVVKSSSIRNSYPVEECIPRDSYVNVSTPGGTSAKKIKVKRVCTNTLL